MVAFDVFSCLKSPGSVVFIDDDETFLSVLERVLPGRIHAAYCSQPSQVDFLLAGSAQMLNFERERLMAMCGEGTGFPMTGAIRYLEWTERLNIVLVLVSDHAMPAETGVSLCARHAHEGVQRMLLTGAADVDLAVKAFNSAEIDQFVPKQTPELTGALVEAIDEMSARALLERGQILFGRLPARLQAALGDSEFESNLNELLSIERIRDYVFLANPLGLMCQREDGGIVWVQIEEDTSFEQVQAMVRDSEWELPEVSRMVEERLVANIEMVAQVPGVKPSIVAGTPLAQGYFAAAFVVPEAKPV